MLGCWWLMVWLLVAKCFCFVLLCFVAKSAVKTFTFGFDPQPLTATEEKSCCAICGRKIESVGNREYQREIRRKLYIQFYISLRIIIYIRNIENIER